MKIIKKNFKKITEQIETRKENLGLEIEKLEKKLLKLLLKKIIIINNVIKEFHRNNIM